VDISSALLPKPTTAALPVKTSSECIPFGDDLACKPFFAGADGVSFGVLPNGDEHDY
jgi:hypothetical protein